MPQPQARRGNTISAGRQHIPSIPKCTVDGHGELCVLDSALLRSAILSSSNLPVLTKTLGGTRFLNTLPCRKARWTLWWTSRMPLEQLNSVKQEEQHPHQFFFCLWIHSCFTTAAFQTRPHLALAFNLVSETMALRGQCGTQVLMVVQVRSKTSEFPRHP